MPSEHMTNPFKFFHDEIAYPGSFVLDKLYA